MSKPDDPQAASVDPIVVWCRGCAVTRLGDCQGCDKSVRVWRIWEGGEQPEQDGTKVTVAFDSCVGTTENEEFDTTGSAQHFGWDKERDYDRWANIVAYRIAST